MTDRHNAKQTIECMIVDEATGLAAMRAASWKEYLRRVDTYLAASGVK